MNPNHLPAAASALRAITAGELHRGHIGMVISMDWQLPSGKTHARITGELRQISHASMETILQLCSPHDDSGDLDEIVLYPDHAITLEDMP